MEALKKLIRDVPNFPKKGIIFRDITPLLNDPAGFKKVIETFAKRYEGKKITRIVAVESRGFIFGGALAHRLGIGLAIVRKPGKLPYKTERETYELEYGTDSIEMHVDAVKKGDKVIVLDDLLATGGTAKAAGRLAQKMGGEVVEYAFVIELAFLKGREKLDRAAFSLVQY